MPLNLDHLAALNLPPIRQEIRDSDAMLYALSIGLARDPIDANELRFVYGPGLTAFSTMPLIVGDASDWLKDPATGIDQNKVVHGAQRLENHHPLPIGGTVIFQERIKDLFDKGDRGAVLVTERVIFDADSGALLARTESTIFARADGNFGGPAGPMRLFRNVPDRQPDEEVDIAICANAALLYRLNQDRNPLHADPAFAARAGYPRPILHGLCTYGMVAAALSRAHAHRPIAEIEARFSRPVFPGETIAVAMWREGDEVAFQAEERARGEIVLDRGRASFRPA